MLMFLFYLSRTEWCIEYLFVSTEEKTEKMPWVEANTE